MAIARITRNRAHRLKALLLILAILVASAVYAQDAGWQQEITAWRAQHAVELQKPDGWLALAGLEWLEAGDTSFGAAKGSVTRLQPFESGAPGRAASGRRDRHAKASGRRLPGGIPD